MAESTPDKQPAKIAIEVGHSDILAMAVGHLFMSAATSEVWLTWQIMRLFGKLEPQARAFTAASINGMEIKVKIGMMRIFFNARSRGKDKNFSKICDDVIAAYEIRNKLAHCSVGSGKYTGKLEVLSGKVTSSGAFPQAEYYTAEQIVDANGRMHAAVDAVRAALTAAGFPQYEK